MGMGIVSMLRALRVARATTTAVGAIFKPQHQVNQINQSVRVLSSGTVMEEVRKGLVGVLADKSAVSTVGRKDVGLTYRGYRIEDLARVCSFEQVSWLLMRGSLPTAEDLQGLQKKLVEARRLPDEVKVVLEQMPASAHPMDVLRSGCSVLGTLEPEEVDNVRMVKEHEAVIRIGERLIGSFGPMILYWYHFHQSGERLDIDRYLNDEDSLSQVFLKLLFK